MTEYALEFCKHAAGSGWNEPTIKAVFHCGLNENVKLQSHVMTIMLMFSSIWPSIWTTFSGKRDPVISWQGYGHTMVCILLTTLYATFKVFEDG